MWIGDFRLGSTLDLKFCTCNTSGAPTTLAGSPAVSAYPDNSTTQLTAGITLTVDFDGVTGLHNVRVVATSGNGYATATNYALVITAGTVGGTSVVGYVVGHFSIENRSPLMPTVAARTLDVTATGAAGVDWANVENPTTALNLSGTNIDVDQVVASVSGAVGSVTGAVGSVTGAVGSVTGAVGSVTGAVGSVTGAVGSVTGNIGGNLLGTLSAAERNAMADQVWDEAIAGHLGAGSTGAALNAAGSAGDPWTTPLPGAYGAGTAGNIVGNNLDAAVSSRASTVTLALVKAKTDLIPAVPAAVGSAMTLTSSERDSVADALLDRDMSLGADSGSPTVRTPRQALRFNRNKWSIAGGTLVVTKEDDTTASWSATVTQTAGNPVSELDPA